MPYFPMFIDLKDRPCLIVGGGAVAARKVEKLLPYGPALTVVAPEFCPELEAMSGVTLCRRELLLNDLNGNVLVIAATDDAELNQAVSRLCKQQNTPVNVVDDKEACSFLFPCLVQKGELSVGISTGGASPTGAVWLKDQVTDLIPAHFDEILDFLDSMRPWLKNSVESEEDRARLFARLFRECLALDRGLTLEEMEQILKEETP